LLGNNFIEMLTGDGVSVKTDLCLKVGLKLREMPVRKDFLSRPFLSHPMDTEARMAMLFYAVAICHQTRSLRSDKCQLFGWEYIENVFLDLAINNSYLIDPLSIRDADPVQIGVDLATAFSDTGDANLTTLDRIGERVILMKESSLLVNSLTGGRFSKLIELTENLLLNNGMGFYELLGKSQSFGDPLRKKSSFLIKLLIDAGLYSVRDKENYIPIMDYHMQRVLLRLGCVEVSDHNLWEALTNRIPMSTDKPVRIACIEAIRKISEYSGIDIWQMNDYFWTLGRSCCNETTLCTDGKCSKNPCSFQSIISIPDHRHCSFEYICRGAGDAETRSLWEPIVETHYY